MAPNFTHKQFSHIELFTADVSAIISCPSSEMSLSETSEGNCYKYGFVGEPCQHSLWILGSWQLKRHDDWNVSSKRLDVAEPGKPNIIWCRPWKALFTLFWPTFHWYRIRWPNNFKFYFKFMPAQFLQKSLFVFSSVLIRCKLRLHLHNSPNWADVYRAAASNL